jgi:hypothetical protein
MDRQNRGSDPRRVGSGWLATEAVFTRQAHVALPIFGLNA